MTVYNINHGIGWASSGVEYAQAYRSSILKKLKIPAKFVFTDFFAQDNLSDLTRNIGFSDDDIIWLYGAFTDVKVAPVTFTLADLQKQYHGKLTKTDKTDKIVKFYYEEDDVFLTAYLNDLEAETVHRVEIVSRGVLIRKDFYNYTKVFSEYYIPKDNQAKITHRSFYNEDGSVAYQEMIEGKQSFFKFPKRLIGSKTELFDYFMQSLPLTEQDVVILDRSTDTGQSVLKHSKPAKIGVVVHAEHFSENAVTDDTILWNNFYDYQFTNADKVDFFITATAKQKELLAEQFRTYTKHTPKIVTIPVGSIDSLKTSSMREPYAILTASRLAMEKHVDWLAKAVVAVHDQLPQVTFDIYGHGTEQAKIQKIISDNHAENYIRLMGHHDLTDVYQDYELYLSASKSEGFGLTLLEAIGAGLPLIGFDVRYGNQTFIKDGQNGYLLPRFEVDNEETIVSAFKDKILALFALENRETLHQVSYDIAKGYLTTEVEQKWKQLIEEMTA